MAKAKGTTLIGVVKALRQHKEEARARLPADLHHYLAQTRVSAPSWYPESDLLALIRALVDLTPTSRGETLAAMGVATARAHGGGVYSHLTAGGGSASATLALWSSMHDTGRLTSAFAGDDCVRFELRDYAHPSRELCAITTAYIQETLRLSGRIVRVEKRACANHGDPHCVWLAIPES